MILALLHLTDLHFKAPQANVICSRIRQIIAALRSTEMLIDSCLVIVSGDVAFSGRQEEYDIALSFFNELQEGLQNNYGKCPIVVVPGNHDCDFRKHSDLRQAAIQSVNGTNGAIDPSGRLLSELLSVQGEFFSFWRKLKAITGRPNQWLAYREQFEIHAHRVAVNSLNTAFLSTLREQQGSLRFPIEVAETELRPAQEADLVLSVFHHPYGWLESNNSRAFKKLIESMSDIVLTGHEHVEDYYEKSVITGEHLEYVEGAVLQSENPSTSGFNVVLCDLDKKSQKITDFRWSEDRYIALVNRQWRRFLRNESFRKNFENEPEFALYLDSIGTGFTHPRKPELKLSDLFIYPELRIIDFDVSHSVSKTNSIVQSEKAFDSLLSEKLILLTGPELAGKSALTRTLYRDFQVHKFVPILVRGRDFAVLGKRGFTEAIEKVFIEQYGVSRLEAFKQLSPEEKVLIFDDYHLINITSKQRMLIIDAAKRIFGRVVVVATDILRIEEIAEGKEDSNPFVGFKRFDIRQFSHRLRGRLIEKWLTLERDHNVDEQALAREIDDSEKAIRTLLGKKLLPSFPLIILTMLQGLESGKATSSPSGSFGYLYEYLITTALSRIGQDAVQLDISYVILSRLAFYLFEKKLKRFTKADVQSVADEYHAKYDIRRNSERLIRELEASGLIFHSDGNYGFRFKYAYYYFVARYFRDAMKIERDKSTLLQTLKGMADRVYYEDYLNILLFVLYLTGDLDLILYVISRSESIYGKTEPCNFGDHISFINRLYTERPELILPQRSYEEARDEQRSNLDADDEQTQASQVAEDDSREVIYTDDLEELLKINIAFKTLTLMGQILRNFPGSLQKETKLDLTRACYSLGLRTLRAVLGIAEQNLPDFREYVAEIIREHRPPQSDLDLARTTDEAVIWLTRRCSYGTLKRISFAVGLEVLTETYRRVLETEGAPSSFKLVDLTVKLDHFDRFPETELESLWNEYERNNFCQVLIQELVGYHLSLHPLDDRTKQSVCALLHIKFERILPRS